MPDRMTVGRGGYAVCSPGRAGRRPRRARIVTAGGADMTADRVPRDAELAEELEGPATDLAADVEPGRTSARSEEHTSELQSQSNLVCRLLLEKKKSAK